MYVIDGYQWFPRRTKDGICCGSSLLPFPVACSRIWDRSIHEDEQTRNLILVPVWYRVILYERGEGKGGEQGKGGEEGGRDNGTSLCTLMNSIGQPLDQGGRTTLSNCSVFCFTPDELQIERCKLWYWNYMYMYWITMSPLSIYT